MEHLNDEIEEAIKKVSIHFGSWVAVAGHRSGEDLVFTYDFHEEKVKLLKDMSVADHRASNRAKWELQKTKKIV